MPTRDLREGEVLCKYNAKSKCDQICTKDQPSCGMCCKEAIEERVKLTAATNKKEQEENAKRTAEALARAKARAKEAKA